MTEAYANTAGAEPERASGANGRLRPFEGWRDEDGAPVVPDARLLNGGPRKAPKLPLDVFGALAPWISDLAAAKRAPVDYVAVPLLGYAAGIVGAARDVRIDNSWREPCILWIACVGNPSSGKSPPLATLKNAALAIEREEAGDLKARKREYEQKLAEAEAIESEWQAALRVAMKNGSQAPKRPELADAPEEPHAPRLLAADATREALAWLMAKRSPRGVLLALDELMGLIGNFGKFGGRDEPFYLAAYGGDFAPVDRKSSETLLAARAYLSIVGAIQPDMMQGILSGRANDGLVSRFLPVWPDPQGQWLREVPRVNEGVAVELMQRLRSLSMQTDDEGKLSPVEVPLSDGAADIFFAWAAEQHARGLTAHGFMADFLGKSKGTCARVALALELLEWAADIETAPGGPAEISAESMERACRLFADYFEPMALRVYADAAAAAEERGAIALLKEIQAQGVRQFNARKARREWGVPGLSSAAAMDAALAVLKEGGCIREVEREPGQKGRRESAWLVNPVLLRGLAR